MRRSPRTAVLTLAASLGLATGPAVLWPAGAGAEPVSTVFAYNGTDGSDGSPQTFTVPDGVCRVTVDALGAQGGRGGSGQFPAGPGGEAGLGGRVAATIAVTPGEVLTVRVGGAGLDGSLEDPSPSSGFGGFNGGGAGGDISGGGGGGGASDVRQGGDDLADRVVVAGGGGGGGVDGAVPDGVVAGGVGGAGGGLDGLPGGDGSPYVQQPAPTGGGGGSQSAGGAAGSVQGGLPAPTAGVLGQGGLGGANGVDNPDGGGGGGGGYFGGGGGGGGYAEAASAGGGGGSGFGPADATFETGVRQGHGQVTITFDTEAGGCPTAPTPPPAAQPVVEAPRFTG